MLGIVCQIGLLWLYSTTNTFKRRLDTYWQDQEIIYDFHAQFQGTGSRSEVFRYEWLIDHIGYVKVWNEAGIEA